MFVVFPNSGQVRPRGIYHMRIYKTGLLAAAAVAVLTSAAAPAQAWQAASSAEARAAINIPAQDLGRAIQTLSRQTGLQIVFDPELTRGQRAQAVSGSMTPREALRRMIAGSGVEAREVRGVLTLVRQTAEASMPTPDATVLEEVLVVGYAAGMRRSLDAKRDADFISDVISADDMGDLPANNVAESLSRLPGVNAVRNHTTGEGDRITIRGLSTELNNYTMNGVRIGGTGSPDDSFYRGVRLSFLPPEGIDSITVVKSLTPDRDGDALGGSIDIRTPTAFDHSRPTASCLPRPVCWTSSTTRPRAKFPAPSAASSTTTGACSSPPAGRGASPSSNRTASMAITSLPSGTKTAKAWVGTPIPSCCAAWTWRSARPRSTARG